MTDLNKVVYMYPFFNARRTEHGAIDRHGVAYLDIIFDDDITVLIDLLVLTHLVRRKTKAIPTYCAICMDDAVTAYLAVAVNNDIWIEDRVIPYLTLATYISTCHNAAVLAYLCPLGKCGFLIDDASLAYLHFTFSILNRRSEKFGDDRDTPVWVFHDKWYATSGHIGSGRFIYEYSTCFGSGNLLDILWVGDKGEFMLTCIGKRVHPRYLFIISFKSYAKLLCYLAEFHPLLLSLECHGTASYDLFWVVAFDHLEEITYSLRLVSYHRDDSALACIDKLAVVSLADGCYVADIFFDGELHKRHLLLDKILMIVDFQNRDQLVQLLDDLLDNPHRTFGYDSES